MNGRRDRCLFLAVAAAAEVAVAAVAEPSSAVSWQFSPLLLPYAYIEEHDNQEQLGEQRDQVYPCLTELASVERLGPSLPYPALFHDGYAGLDTRLSSRFQQMS